jgi:hypothetical protein
MSIMFVLLLALAFVPVVNAEIADHVVISEIQADSIEGTGGTEDDWIELYNPTNEDINLSAGDYRIYKAVTADPYLVMRIGNTLDGTYPGGTTIPAYGFYLIVQEDANQTLKDEADAIGNRTDFTWTGSGYTLYLGNDTISSDDDPDIVDKVGFGTATYCEGSSAPAIPEAKSLQRKVNATINESAYYGPACDSNCNCDDFFIQDSPNPQNSTWIFELGHKPLPPVPELPSIFLLAIGLITLAGYVLLTKRRFL